MHVHTIVLNVLSPTHFAKYNQITEYQICLKTLVGLSFSVPSSILSFKYLLIYDIFNDLMNTMITVHNKINTLVDRIMKRIMPQNKILFVAQNEAIRINVDKRWTNCMYEFSN